LAVATAALAVSAVCYAAAFAAAIRASCALAMAAAAATSALRLVEEVDISQAMNSGSDYQLLEDELCECFDEYGCSALAAGGCSSIYIDKRDYTLHLKKNKNLEVKATNLPAKT
jgi:hypothetical protein